MLGCARMYSRLCVECVYIKLTGISLNHQKLLLLLRSTRSKLLRSFYSFPISFCYLGVGVVVVIFFFGHAKQNDSTYLRM